MKYTSQDLRITGVPIDEIWLSAGLPRTIFLDHDRSPKAHRNRALGRPIFSFLGLVTSHLARALVFRDSMSREVANWSSSGSGQNPLIPETLFALQIQRDQVIILVNEAGTGMLLTE